MTEVAFDHNAERRLHQLGLTVGVLQRAILRADAEANQVTGLEPPTAEGTTRYFKTVRFLREEVVPAGWGIDNSKNFCRTVHPSGEFSIVTSSGDTNTGVYTPGVQPSTKYAKGESTSTAVQVNAGQLAFDLGDEFDEFDEARINSAENGQHEIIWFLMQHVVDDTIFAELSLPTQIAGGLIQDWQERIILPPTSRSDSPPTGDVDDLPDGGRSDDDDGTDGYSVEVSPR